MTQPQSQNEGGDENEADGISAGKVSNSPRKNTNICNKMYRICERVTADYWRTNLKV